MNKKQCPFCPETIDKCICGAKEVTEEEIEELWDKKVRRNK